MLFKYSDSILFFMKKMNERGRPRRKNLAFQPIFIRFTKAQHEKLRGISAKKDISIMSIARRAVGKYLEGM